MLLYSNAVRCNSLARLLAKSRKAAHGKVVVPAFDDARLFQSHVQKQPDDVTDRGMHRMEIIFD